MPPQKWWRKYKHSVFQIRLGNTRAVVVNSFDDCRKMMLGHQSAVIDRPKLYTFHGVISSTQGFTIGSSPWDESCKVSRRRPRSFPPRHFPDVRRTSARQPDRRSAGR